MLHPLILEPGSKPGQVEQFYASNWLIAECSQKFLMMLFAHVERHLKVAQNTTSPIRKFCISPDETGYERQGLHRWQPGVAGGKRFRSQRCGREGLHNGTPFGANFDMSIGR